MLPKSWNIAAPILLIFALKNSVFACAPCDIWNIRFQCEVPSCGEGSLELCNQEFANPLSNMDQ